MNKNDKYPLKKIKTLIFLKNFITNPNIEIGDYTYYSSNNNPENFQKENVFFAFNSKLKIGKFCQIAEGVKFMLSDSNHITDTITTYPFDIFGIKQNVDFNTLYKKQRDKKGDTIIQNDVWIGSNAIIMPGVKIGNGAIIGAGSVVTKNISDYEIWAGNPAKLIRKRFSDEKIIEILDLKWWNWNIEEIEKNLPILMKS